MRNKDAQVGTKYRLNSVHVIPFYINGGNVASEIGIFPGSVFTVVTDYSDQRTKLMITRFHPMSNFVETGLIYLNPDKENLEEVSS